MSSGEEMPFGEQSPRRLSQIFEPLVEFQKSAHTQNPNISIPNSSGKIPKLNASSSKLTTKNSNSTPNSPRYIEIILKYFDVSAVISNLTFNFRLFSKRNRSMNNPPTAAFIANPSLLYDNAPSSWSHVSELTEQINNYQQEYSEINWQERALELQLELHRSRNQASRVRDMLKEKVFLRDLYCGHN